MLRALWPKKPTSGGSMSALPQKADIGASTGNVRLVPEAEVTEETFLSPLGVKIGRSEAVH